MYKKKKTLSPPRRYSSAIAVCITIAVFCILEYFFFFPSRFIHDLEIVTSLFSSQPEDKCFSDFAPVCGKDGVTYRNSCFSKVAKVPVARVGKCEGTSGATSTGVAKLPDRESVTSTGTIPSPETSSPIVTSSSSGMIFGSGELEAKKYQLYTNKNFGYSLALPKFAYFQGLVSADKKSHILTIDTTASGSQNTEQALVKVSFYRSGLTAPLGKKNLTLDSGVLVVDYTLPLSPQGQEIIEAIESTARSLEN